MKTLKKPLLLLSFSFLALCGCATTQTPNASGQPVFEEYGKPLGTHYLTKPGRQSQLSAIHSWTAQGNIAVHTAQKGFNASFNWQQQNQNFDIALFGPLGSNRVQLSGMPGQVTLQTPNKTASANSAESLLQQQLGWSLPVSNLYYWMRGIPAPGSRPRLAYDMNNHVVHLDQQGWHIIYLRYLAVNGIDLPSRVLISNPQLQIQVVITGWQFNG